MEAMLLVLLTSKIKSTSSRVMESGFKAPNILRLNQSQPIFIANQEIF
jgi:hypothetical protein